MYEKGKQVEGWRIKGRKENNEKGPVKWQIKLYSTGGENVKKIKIIKLKRKEFFCQHPMDGRDIRGSA